MNQAFLADILKPHLQVVIFGDVKLDSTGLHFMNPEYELDVGRPVESCTPGASCPFYEKTGTVTPNMQRRLVRQALDQLPADIPDLLPADLRTRLELMPRRAALEESHFPPNEAIGRRAERVPHAGAAAADLRGVLSVPDRPRLAAPRDEHGAEAVSCRRSTTASARRRRRCCRSS